MKYGMIIPKGQLDQKPPHGAPCTRCGLCCKAVICPTGKQIFGHEEGPCPALIEEPDKTFACGLVKEPARWRQGLTLVNGAKAMREAALFLIGSGVGCDARFNGEPGNEAFYERLRRHDQATRSRGKAAKRTWGIS